MPETKTTERKGFFESIIDFLREVFDLDNYLDKDQAIKDIKAGINFKGIAAYILIASVMVASVGLNADSVAVVIGAMLISPLMGPIVGMGYSVAVNDLETLRKSLVNFGIMVVIALLTSFLYFTLAPLAGLNDQLRGRIEPTSLDVLIAFFGGLAGIAALCSKLKNSNVIAGVAIATALMPPLCTAGYGFSQGFSPIGYKDYTGVTAGINALYLFFINSVFIAISTFLFLKATRFPLVKYQNAEQRKRTNFMIFLLALVTVIPSAFIFYNIVREDYYRRTVNNFLKDEVEVSYPNAFINLDRPVFTDLDTIKYVTISTINQRIPDETIENWNKELHVKYNLPNTYLTVQQGAIDESMVKEEGQKFFQKMYDQNLAEMERKDSLINKLQAQVNVLNSDSIPFQSISSEIKAQYPEIEHFGYGKIDYTDYHSKHMIPSYYITWKTPARTPQEKAQRKKDEERVRAFLKTRLKQDTIQQLAE